MKTLLKPVSRIMVNPVLLLGATALLLTSQATLAQHRQNEHLAVHTEKTATTTPAFQAAIIPVLDPLKLKVVFLNPEGESLTLQIRNDQNEIVYRKEIGRVESFNSSFYLSEVPDGGYTAEIIGKSIRFAKDFRIETKVARMAQVK